MAKKCSICEIDSDVREPIEKALTNGTMDIATAADRLGVGEKNLWNHLNKHVGTEFDNIMDLNMEEQIRTLAGKLSKLVDKLFEMSPDVYVKQLPSLIRELRGFIELMGKKRGEIPPSRVVVFGNIDISVFEQFILTKLDGDSKNKIAEFIEAENSKVIEVEDDSKLLEGSES